MPVRVAVLDDDERFRRQLLERLRFFQQVDVVADAGTPQEFFRKLPGLSVAPEVALVDIGLPGASGIEVAARLSAEHHAVSVLMLTVFEEPDTVLAAIQAGASGYLLKDSSAEAIVRAILEVHEGGVPLSPPVARHVLKLIGRLPASPRASPPPDPGASPSPLSSREIELLERIVQGETEAEIAAVLGISPHTVRTHVKNIYRKLRVHSRAAAVRLTYERHLLDRAAPSPEDS